MQVLITYSTNSKELTILELGGHMGVPRSIFEFLKVAGGGGGGGEAGVKMIMQTLVWYGDFL